MPGYAARSAALSASRLFAVHPRADRAASRAGRATDRTMPRPPADVGWARPAASAAHRGGGEMGPQGTYAAYQSALAAGADYLEFDVRRPADGELVAFHPARIGR